MLRLRVSDDGPGVADPTFFQEGIGLTNTRARLERLYGAAQKVTVETGAGRGFAVELELPLAYDASPEELPEMRA
jgi:signal transduction histidine kinase